MTLSPPSFLEHSLFLQSQAFVGVKVMVAVEERRQFGRTRLYTVMPVDALKRVLPREQICINKGFAFSTYSKPRHPFFFILSSSTLSLCSLNMDEIGIEIRKEVSCNTRVLVVILTDAVCMQEPTFESVVTEKSQLLQELQEEDLYIKYKKLTRHLEMLEIQEGYIKDEQANLKRELIRAQEEVKRIQSVPLVIGQFLEPIDQTTGIVGSTTGSNYVVRILSTLDRELLKPSSSVALHRHSNALVDILPPEADSSISMLGAEEKPDVTYQDVGGMDSQKQEIREAVELPLTHFDLYKKIGIDPPRGVLLYGPPGKLWLSVL